MQRQHECYGKFNVSMRVRVLVRVRVRVRLRMRMRVHVRVHLRETSISPGGAFVPQEAKTNPTSN